LFVRLSRVRIGIGCAEQPSFDGGEAMRILFVAALIFCSACTLGAADPQTWALRGQLLMPDGAIENGVIVIADQKIVAAGKDIVPPPGTPVTDVSGLILPGFIDLHNHLTWNLFPRWRPGRDFHNRYEWQATAEYDRLMSSPHARLFDANLGCYADLFAQVKAIAGGATSVVGSFFDKNHPYENECVGGLARNLDVNSGFMKASLGQDPCVPPAEGPKGLVDIVAYEVFPFELSRERVDFYRCELSQGNLRSFVIHVAEGSPSDPSAHREFRMLKAQGFLREGVVLVHGTALTADDFQAMQASNVGLIWSPRSNDELYGGTANVPAAQKAGVTIAIAPDWSPTGSAGMLQELNYAAARYPSFFNAKQLLSMATAVPAKVARLDDKIGKLQSGHYADLTVIRTPDGSPESIVKSTPADVQLVIVGGQAVYGDPGTLGKLLPGQTLDTLTVCGAMKAVFLGGTGAAKEKKNWGDVTKALKAALEREGLVLAPLECN
jgi:5-methylthioadenosine/S-adenosylhomocysteine deaminase